MVLTLDQYNEIFGTKKSSFFSTFYEYEKPWGVSMQDQAAKYKWEECNSDYRCYGIFYVISARLSPWIKEIEKRMKEIELVTCIR